jgi:predicted NAD-dependent protein-ADP-ribosyltransferase YbiA (DUF1768 family)
MLFRGEYWFLSNMFPCSVVSKALGVTFKCSESAFMAMKSDPPALHFAELDGFTAKKAGRKLKLRANWNSIRVSVMRKVLAAKFSDPCLLAMLKDVEGEIVEDNHWNDTFWGKCNGVGLNWLGRLLMEIRDA